MRQHEVATLLRIKRAREQKASAEAARTRAAAYRAQVAGHAAHAASNSFGERRRAQETEIYARLAVERLPVVALQEAASRLTGIAAYAAILRQQIVRAEAECEATAQACSAAERLRLLATRALAAGDAVHDRVQAAMARQEDAAGDAELETVCDLHSSRPTT
jgi:hypothetical protein